MVAAFVSGAVNVTAFVFATADVAAAVEAELISVSASQRNRLRGH